MPDIILPRPIPALTTRRRSVDAPTAGNVPTIDPAVARDPGLNVLRGAFGGGIGAGLEAAGSVLSDYAARLQKEEERQNNLKDATEGTKIREGVTNNLRDGLTARMTQADFADEAVRGEYDAFVGNTIVEAKRQFTGTDGIARLSDGAMARLGPELDDIGQVFRDRGDSLHLKRLEQRGIDQLTLSADEAAGRARSDVAAIQGDDAFEYVTIQLELFDETAAEFSGALKGDKDQEIRTAGRAKIIEAALFGFAENGRGEEVQALLGNDAIGGQLDGTTRARLKRDTATLSEAHDRDRTEREKRKAAEEARARETAALAFTTGFRPRMATGEATLADIATAHIDGVLSTAQADRLRADLADHQSRRDAVLAWSERISSVLQTGGRLDPEDFDDHDDVAHHYAATLKPSLADLDPAQKAAAIGGYVAETGIAPDSAVKSLLGLTATGDATNRIAAARELVAVFAIDPTARNKVPQTLFAYANMLVQLADMETIPPDEAIRTMDAFFAPGTGADQPNAALLLLAKAKSYGAKTDGQPDDPAGGALVAQPDASSQLDTEENSSVKQSPQSEIESNSGGSSDFDLAQTSSASANGSKNASKPPSTDKAGIIPNLSPTKNIVDVDRMNRTFQFDLVGPGEIEEALKSPVAGISAGITFNNSLARARQLVEQKTLSHDEANALLHAVWSFEVTREFGPEIAKKFGDAHERTSVNKDGDRLKDLFNNNAGRVLATDPANRNRLAEEVVLEAIRAGKLQIDPVRVPSPPAGILQPPPRHSPFSR